MALLVHESVPFIKVLGDLGEIIAFLNPFSCSSVLRNKTAKIRGDCCNSIVKIIVDVKYETKMVSYEMVVINRERFCLGKT